MTSRRRPARLPAPGQPADGAAGGDLVAGFAAQLRELRERAGRPSYRQLAQRAHYSHTALSQAAAGGSLPSLAVTQAFVRSCDGDEEEWTARWHQVNQAVRPSAEPPSPSAPSPPAPGPSMPGPARLAYRWRAAAGWVPARVQVAAAAGMAAAACITSVLLLWPAGPPAAPGLPGSARPRLQMESSGLYVRYVVVTNLGTGAGYAYVVNNGNDKTHRSPRPVPPGQSWMYFFNRDLKDGAQICGSIDLGPATCTAVHA
jgi:hypothetical protein